MHWQVRLRKCLVRAWWNALRPIHAQQTKHVTFRCSACVQSPAMITGCSLRVSQVNGTEPLDDPHLLAWAHRPAMHYALMTGERAGMACGDTTLGRCSAVASHLAIYCLVLTVIGLMLWETVELECSSQASDDTCFVLATAHHLHSHDLAGVAA